MNAAALLEASVFGPMRHSPGRMALAIIAIALGVALGLAIHLINRSAADEISLAARSLYGLADLSIEGVGASLDETLYPRIARAPGVAAVSPVVQVEAKLVGARGALTLLGVDPFRSQHLQPAFATAVSGASGANVGVFDPYAVYLSARASRELDLQVGDTLKVQAGLETFELNVAGVLPAAALGQRAGIVDIALAQWRFDRLGELSRIDVRLAPGANIEQSRAVLQSLAPAHARVAAPGSADDEALRLSRAYRSNLTALALVALFTGGFFVYSTQSLLALRRRREFAVLHAMGMTRGQQLAALLSGAAVLGVGGAVLGVVLGAAIARLGLQQLGADLGAGYFRGVSPELSIRGGELVVFGGLGLIVAIIGALRPALDAARTPTASALKAGDVLSGTASVHPWRVLVLLALAVAALLTPPIAGLPLPGYAAIALLTIAAVAASPLLVRLLTAAAPQLHTPPYQIAMAQIAGASRYATLSVSAIIVSFSLMTSMAIMVTSFRDSLDAWTQRVLPADLYIRVGYVGQSAAIDAQTAARLQSLPGVERAAASRFARAQVEDAPRELTVIARPVDPDRIEEWLWVTQRSSRTPQQATSVWLNEAAADLFEWALGEVRTITISGRSLEVVAQGLWRDYEHQSGALIIDRERYIALTGDDAVNTVWFWLDEGATPEALAQAIRDALPVGAEFEMRTPPELRRLSLAVFDRTFAVTYLLELVAILIGLFGIAAGVSAQVLTRRGEFGALRHLGFTRGQVAAMLAIEGAVLGAIGVIVGLIAGVLVGLILIYVVNRQSFHWSMDLTAPVGTLALLSAALVGSAALIAVFSGRRAMSGDVVGAVKEDW